MNRLSKILLACGLLLFLLSVILFSYKQNIFIASPIDAERFSQFGTFISAILSLITIIFIYFTFKQTQQTHQIADRTLTEAQKNSLDNTFFNLIQAQQNIVSHLHQRITLQLKLQYVNLSEQNGNSNPNQDHKDFFELMYGMLDLIYKGRNGNSDKNKISEYFKNQEWVMGHYFRSLQYFINWVEDNSELTNDPERRTFYIGFIQSQLTSDEIRLFFYYVVSREEPQRKMICKTLNKYSFFSSVKDTLIYQGQQGDWDYFLSLVV